MRAPLVFPSSSSPGARPGEGAGRMVNVEAAKDGDSTAHFPAAGLSNFAELGYSNPRGALLTDQGAYWVVGSHVIRVASDRTTQLMTGSTIPGDGPVTLARNNKVPLPDVVIVADSTAFLCDGTTVTDYPDSDVGSPLGVTDIDSYFVFYYGDGSTIASDLNSTNINTLSSTKIQGRPGGLTRAVTKDGNVLYFKPDSVEFWYDAGTQPFPLARRIDPRDVGLLGPWAVAGMERGWDGPLLWVAQDRTVRRLQGYEAATVSEAAVERAINRTNPADLRAMVYTSLRGKFWSLSGPDWTWEYNVTTGSWRERESYGLTKWRGQVSVRAFGRWLIGDSLGQTLLTIDDNSRREAGQPLVCMGEGKLKDHPTNFRCGALYVDISTGQGIARGIEPIETDPKVALSWSFDGGGIYGTPVHRSIGRQGYYGQGVSVRGGLGRARNQGVWVRWQISDPVPFAFRGMSLDIDQRRS